MTEEQKARAKAERLIAEAQKIDEIREKVCAAVPVPFDFAVHVHASKTYGAIGELVFKGHTANAKGNDLKTSDDVLAVVDAFEDHHVDTFDVKTQYRRAIAATEHHVEPEREGVEVVDHGHHFAHVKISARCAGYMSASQDAEICFFAEIPDLGVVKVSIRFCDAYWDALPYPAALRVGFSNNSASGTKQSEWVKTRPAADIRNLVSFGTGAPTQQMAGHYVGMIPHRQWIADLFV